MRKWHAWREARREKKKGKANDQQDNAYSTKADNQQEAPVERGEDEGHSHLGMHVLIPKESDEEAVVDIVALHGLVAATEFAENRKNQRHSKRFTILEVVHCESPR